MSKYIAELKKVTWPKSDEVFSQFWIVLIGIVLLAIFFLIADKFILDVVEKLYT